MKNTCGSRQRRSAGQRALDGNPHSLLRAAVLSSLAGVAAAFAPAHSNAHAEAPAACAARGNWIDVKTGQSLERGRLFRDIVAKPAVVLLGEYHTDADHHRWQLQTLAAIHGRGGNLIIGFEAFPRRLQGVLDDWVDGKLTEDAFLKASEWRQVWGYDSALYMPLFEFARLNGIPMIALNVERKLVSQVGQRGWENIPVSEREGLSAPAPASPAYQRELAKIYLLKKSLPPGVDPLSAGSAPTPQPPDEAALAEVVKQPEFQHFVAAQQTWDRAMAEALASAQRKFPEATIAGILGAGHVDGGYGVPHQLKSLGIAELKTFLPASIDTACTLVDAGAADVVFTLPLEEDAPPAERPRLGVMLGAGDGAPRISRVVNDSVAALAGLKAGDDVVRAAGLAMRTPDELVEVVGRQAPGTWLPLAIRRDGQEIEVIAKFPPRRRAEQ